MSAAPSSVRHRVAVTAVGVVSPLGDGAVENAASLKAGRDAVRNVAGFDVSRCRAKTAGQIPESWSFPGAGARWHRASHLSAAAMREAQRGDPGFIPELAVIGTTSGGMSFGE